jgi:Ca2+/Na+ antiporter
MWSLTVEPADQPRPKPLPAETSKHGANFASLGLIIGLAILIIAIRLANFQSPRVELALSIAVITVILVFTLLSVGVIRKLYGTERQAKTVLEDREREFHESNLRESSIRSHYWTFLPVVARRSFFLRRGHPS